MKRICLPVSILALSMILGPPVASAAAASAWCSDVPAPCIASATLNGISVVSGDPDWDVSLSPVTSSGSNELLWQVQSKGPGGPYELGPDSLDDQWVITINTGGVNPRVAFTHGANVTVSRGGTVTITATPIIVTGECDQSVWPWSCPATATQEWVGYLDGSVTDYGSWANAAQRAAMDGMNFSTNISATSVPPEIENDPATGEERLLIRLANPHFRQDGTTVFTGFAHLRIPNAFLKKAYGIDDPSTLTGAGLSPSVGGPAAGAGTVTVTQESGGDAMLVDIEGLTFSSRLVRISRGRITPTKPTHLRAGRANGSNARLRFDPAAPRGSRIKGYEARCRYEGGVVSDTGKRSPLTVNGVGSGASCRVRARSRAGPGKFSASDRVG